MPRSLLITVGTSLFESASWEPTASPLRRNQHYQAWIASCLENPTYRRRFASAHEQLVSLLQTDNAEHWVKHLAEDLRKDYPTQALRYSAEMTTLIRLAAETAPVREYLDTFDHILLPYDPSEPVKGKDDRPVATSRVAAHHIAAYLRSLTVGTVTVKAIEGLSSREPADLRRGLVALRRLADSLTGDGCALDLITSGGYKIYGHVLYPLAACRTDVRLHYLHETGAGVVTLDREGLRALGDHPIPVSFPNTSSLEGS